MKECSLSLSLSSCSFLSITFTPSLYGRSESAHSHTLAHKHKQTEPSQFQGSIEPVFQPAGWQQRSFFSISQFQRSIEVVPVYVLSLSLTCSYFRGFMTVTLHMWFYRDNQSWSKTPLFPIQGNFLKFVLCVIWPWLKVMNKPGRQNKMNKALSVLYWVLIM